MSIIELAKFRKVKPKPQGEYCCLKCNYHQFQITESGAIHCASCGAQISNLKVINTKVPA